MSVLLLLFVFKKRNVNNKGKVAEEINSFIELEESEKLLFDTLILNSQSGGLTSEQINELLGFTNKSLENQRKLRSDFLKNIEKKLTHIYQIGNPIERIPSKIDKRMIGYVLNPKLLELIKKGN